MKHELGIAERLRALARRSDIDERISGRRDVSRYEDGTGTRTIVLIHDSTIRC